MDSHVNHSSSITSKTATAKNISQKKQGVLADGHMPWACEAFSKHHAEELISSRALHWCWTLFMIKLWNHGLLNACTMNNCSSILERSKKKQGIGYRHKLKINWLNQTIQQSVYRKWKPFLTFACTESFWTTNVCEPDIWWVETCGEEAEYLHLRLR